MIHSVAIKTRADVNSDLIDVLTPALIPQASADTDADAAAASAAADQEAADAAARETFCWKKLDCGHNCFGVPEERHCMPCLNVECAET